jgi:hypothetical protein
MLPFPSDMVELRRRVFVVAVVAAAVTGAACASLPLVGAPPVPAPDVLTGDAIRSLAGARYVHVAGTYVDPQGRHLQVSMVVAASGDSQGSVTIDGRSLELLSAGGRAFSRGAGYWAAADPRNGRLYGDTWVAGQPPGAPATLADLVRPAGIADGLGSRRYGLRQDGTVTVAGQTVLTLTDREGSVAVTATAPTRLVRIEDAPGYVQPDGNREVRLDFDYPARATIGIPDRYIDPRDPKTMPARLQVLATTSGKCDETGCEQAVTVHNTTGPPGGQSVVTVTLTAGTRSPVGTCTANVPPIDSGANAVVRCTVSGPAWTAFAKASGTKAVHGQATLANPPYS